MTNNGLLHPDLLPLHLQVHHLPPPGGFLLNLERKMTMSIFQALVQKLIDRGHEVTEMAVKMSNYFGETEIHSKLNGI